MSRTKPTRHSSPWPGLIAAYRDRLPVGDDWAPITLLEGGTPLIPATRLSARTGCDGLSQVRGPQPDRLLQGPRHDDGGLEGRRGQARRLSSARRPETRRPRRPPTRPAPACTCAVLDARRARSPWASWPRPHAWRQDRRRSTATSTTPGAGPRDRRRLPGIALVNSVNPYRIEGQKTAAFEIVDELGDAPDFHFLPVGNAGNITAYWKGYREYHADGPRRSCRACSASRPRARRRSVRGAPSSNPETIATAIRIGNPASWQTARRRRSEQSGGASRRSPTPRSWPPTPRRGTEGVFVEPASAAGVAGLLKPLERGWVARGSTVVCTVTGNGLKDPDTALRGMPEACHRCPSTPSPWSRNWGWSRGEGRDPDPACRRDCQSGGRGVQRQPRSGFDSLGLA